MSGGFTRLYMRRWLRAFNLVLVFFVEGSWLKFFNCFIWLYAFISSSKMVIAYLQELWTWLRHSIHWLNETDDNNNSFYRSHVLLANFINCWVKFHFTSILKFYYTIFMWNFLRGHTYLEIFRLSWSLTGY